MQRSLRVKPIADLTKVLHFASEFTHYRKRGAGAPPFAPWMMVAILLYA
jgi:hypothetical protein